MKKKLKEVLSSKVVNIACFRDKTSKNFEELARIFVSICKDFNIEKILINGDYILAKKLNATGVHLSSTQFNEIKNAKNLNLYIIISCHNYIDIENAQKLHVNAVSYSPIFQTPNKGETKGIVKLSDAIRAYEDLDIFALGGIIKSRNKLKKLKENKSLWF